MFTKLIVVSATAAALIVADCPMPNYLGSFKHTNAAFLDVLPNDHGGSDLFISTFNAIPFAKGTISRVENIGLALKKKAISSIRPHFMDSKVIWPNGVKAVPPHVKIPGSLSKNRIISCGGFLVPSHGDGKCVVYDLNASGKNSRAIPLCSAGSGNFFHQGTFYDVDGDGYDDLITAKAAKPMFGTAGGSLYWYRNPGASGKSLRHHSEWEENLLLEGPDVHFELVDLDKDGVFEIVASQFFTEKLTVSWLKKDGKFGGGPAQWEQRTIADNLGAQFNLTFVDINIDGREELVITNHVSNAKMAGVYAFEVPVNFKTGIWKAHVLSNNFPTKNFGPGQGSPGGAVPFYMKGVKSPLFAVSGDGNQKAYIMCKNNQGGPWDWKRQELMNFENTVGAIAIADADGDGYPEIFVPSYDKGEIHIFSYST